MPHISWNPNVHYRVRKCPPPTPIMSHIDPVHAPTIHFPKIHLNIIFPSTSVSPKCSLSLRFSYLNPAYNSPLPHTRYTPRPSHSSRFYHRTILGEECRSLSTSLCSFLHSSISTSLIGPNILLNVPFSNTLSLRSSLNASDQVSHP